MLVTKKVNNNVAVCIDGSGRELIALGKGIGFPSMPYELTDLSKIDRTYYDIDSKYLALLQELPADMVTFTARMMDDIRPRLPYEVNSSIVLTLADHIAFAIERAKKGVYIRMPSIFAMEQDYPLEVKIGRRIVSAAEKQFKAKLPKDEVQGVAMHFINARNGLINDAPNPEEQIQQRYEEILEQTTQIIEWELDVKVSRDTFNYARFATHLQYLLTRIFDKTHIDSSNLQIYNSIREEYPAVSDCVDKIAQYYAGTWNAELTEEEKLYLIMHINRVCAKENI